MTRFLLRTGMVAASSLLVASAAAFGGCSNADTPAATDDAGQDGATDGPALPDTGPVDGGDAGPSRDCKADLDPDGLQKHLDCTGLYANFATKTVAASARMYKPGVEFWSDGAEKSRFIFLPPGQKIDVTNFDEWVFPNGTKLWKEFRLGGKRVETRLFMKTTSGSWRHTVYRWNAAETDAVRLDTGEQIPPGAANPNTYEVPNTGQCNTCHDGRTEPVLGFESLSLALPTATGVTLAVLASEGALSAPAPATQLTLPDDPTTTGRPALTWLHANCGACHNSNAGANAVFTGLRFLVRPSHLITDAGTGPNGAAAVEDLDGYTTAYCVDSSRQNDAGLPFKRIAGGLPSESLASVLSGQRSPEGTDPAASIQMPPLVTRRVDTAGHKLLEDWITTLPACP